MVSVNMPMRRSDWQLPINTFNTTIDNMNYVERVIEFYYRQRELCSNHFMKTHALCGTLTMFDSHQDDYTIKLAGESLNARLKTTPFRT